MSLTSIIGDAGKHLQNIQGHGRPAITNIISQISSAGGVARPNLFTVEITIPPAVLEGAALDQFSSKNPIDLVKAGISAALRGPALANIGLINKGWFKKMGLQGYLMGERLKMSCTKAELPEKGFSTSDVRTYGSYFKMPHTDTYGDITLHFIVGRDMIEKHFFDAWSYVIQDPETADFNFVSAYATTIDIFQLNELGISIGPLTITGSDYSARLFQAWPIHIGALQLDYGTNDTYHILPVTFTYRKWINTRIDSQTPTNIQGPDPQNFDNTVIQQRS